MGVQVPKEESNGEQAAEVFCGGGGSGDDTPDYHDAGQVESWLADLVQEKIGWDLHKHLKIT